MILMFIVLFMLIFLLSKIETNNQKNTSFESGFDSKMMIVNFSNQYYMVAVLFLMFDLEIVMILPIPISFSKSFILGSVFIIFFLLVLMFEWKFGMLDWVK